ncbi:type I polyketide synthase [Actinoalloteichus hymeniacidonis]|uniref:Malonyl CoA-acyl carrier protein transacylase n=1 Tax=Actinoalloteichus hymeniacidonis TaxID=340345 RepID=A0AAC9HM32_9PSEU|nr:type I polyketide synthase [Actinoalloteichus hymeniacidonis]AOS61827.1 malonyl CoA-acyl carrier protein transacylase [Actinoalloteichus hymeniacidonis]MBB5910154.1 acyl transferase domain-containing protein [Actinoalloteichus hymeniacidonis]
MSDTEGYDEDLQSSVAVVGLAARVPGVADLDEFWAALVEGRDLTSRLDSGRRYGLLADTDRFDAAFFGISPQDAQLLDPQTRVFLECAWEALEHGGYDPHTYPGAIGVYAGSGESDHLTALRAQRHRFPHVTDEQLRLAGSRDLLTSRVAYALNLHGPAITVHTACSTSLVATHLAGQALLAGDCDLALAGGVTVRGIAGAGEADDLLSPSGYCRPFDAEADGMVGADGAGVVLLKRLTEALEDGDHVHAVIRGSALGNDGSTKMGFTAPSVTGQVAAIRSAHLLADVDPDTIGYVEAHGTGTAIGDAIEFRALTEAFGAELPQPCVLGSVKSNIGHADTAAGVLGLIKVVLSLRHGLIPGTAHFRSPNPHLDLAAGRFTVTSTATSWPAGAVPRRAGVNSTGVGGTNAHLIVEEAPAPPPPAGEDGPHLLPLSARTAAALTESAARLSAHLDRNPVGIAETAWTLQTGRAEFEHRAVVVCRDRAEAVRSLAGLAGAEGPQASGRSPKKTPPQVAFLFPDSPELRVRVARELYEAEPVFRAVFDDCAELAAADLGLDLRQLLYPDSAETAAATTAVAGPALFALQHALAELWGARGIEPNAVLGHSVGAFAAAVSAGVLTRSEALSLVITRGRLLARHREAVRIDDLNHEYAAAVATVRPAPPRIAWISDQTGEPVGASEVADPACWTGHLRRTVRFSDALRTVLTGPTEVLVEIGPGRTLETLVRRHPDFGPDHLFVPGLPGDEGSEAHLEALHALGGVWQAGLPVRWTALHDGRPPRRVPLTTYPFQRERYAIEGRETVAAEPTAAAASEALAAPDTPQPAPDAEAARAPAEPRTPVEKAIVDVWRQVLRVSQIGIDDDFFELGGQSLHATRVLSRLRSALGSQAAGLTVMDIFDHTTIREFATLLEET